MVSSTAAAVAGSTAAAAVDDEDGVQLWRRVGRSVVATAFDGDGGGMGATDRQCQGFVGRHIGRTESVCHLSRNLWRGLEFVLLLIFWSSLCVSTYYE